jgi:hypothetical protein
MRPSALVSYKAAGSTRRSTASVCSGRGYKNNEEVSMSKHECGAPVKLSPKKKAADAAWEKFRKMADSPTSVSLTTTQLRDAVLADIRNEIEQCVDEPARKDLHQGDLSPTGPIGVASIDSLMAMYGEVGVSEDQWKALVLRLARTLMRGPMAALKRMSWGDLKEHVRVNKNSGMAIRWASDLAGTPGIQLQYEHVRNAFDAGQQWAETDRCPDCGGRSHSQEECPAHEDRKPEGNEVLLQAAKAVQDIEVAQRHAKQVMEARQHAGAAVKAIYDAEIQAGRMLKDVLDVIRLEFTFPVPPGWELHPSTMDQRESGTGGSYACCGKIAYIRGKPGPHAEGCDGRGKRR